MYVVLLDKHEELTRLRFTAAVQARLAGNDDVEVPDLSLERGRWEDWLMSELPKNVRRTGSDNVYAALFPENRQGVSTQDMERMTKIDKLKAQGLVTEVSDSG